MRNSFRWNSSSCYEPSDCHNSTAGTTSNPKPGHGCNSPRSPRALRRRTGGEIKTGSADRREKDRRSPFAARVASIFAACRKFFRRTAGVGRTSIDSEASRQNFSNSADGTQRRDSSPQPSNPGSVSVEPVSLNPGSSSSQPSNSRSARILRSQSTHRNRQALSIQLQKESYNEMLGILNEMQGILNEMQGTLNRMEGNLNQMEGILNVIVADAASIARQDDQAPHRTDGGGGGAAAARTNDILRIQQIQRDFNGNDYEILLGLDENNRQHSGASESQINSLPQSTIQNADGSQEDPCAICRDNPAVGDAIRHLPCFHKFHKDCIDLWLERKPLCPICRSDVRIV